MNRTRSAFSLALIPLAAIAWSAETPAPFTYTVPPGGLSRTIRIMHVSGGTPRLVHMGLHKGGETIRLSLPAGSGDRIQIMINGILKEDLPFEPPAPKPASTAATLPLPPAATSTISFPLLPLIVATPTTALPAREASATPAPPLPARPQRIVSAAAVRLRASPSVSAKEVALLALGTILDEREAGASEETIGKRTAKWYRVALPDGREGWLFGAFTLPLPAGNREETFLRLATERLALEKQSPNDLLELYRFLASAAPTGASDPARAELEFHALLALNRYLAALPGPAKPDVVPAAIASEASRLAYSEPAAQYMCNYDTFWELVERAKTRPNADELAWKAAHQPIPGETEGFFDLMIGQADRTSGRYLRAQPAGAHAGEAMNNITEYLFSAGDGGAIREPAGIPADELSERIPQESRKDALDALIPLRAAVAAAAHSGRDALLGRLDALAERIRSLPE
ncbi:MAG TPA: SH3 domain-containing protein [Candidatus Ozemobacteraceae bacterium]|nr:SH3 domain-containing protein [Candidatus Ozemobacteraceae bacterium]